MQDIHLGALIKQKMEERNISIAQLSELIHCDRTNIYSIFKRKSMDIEQLVQISNALHFDFLQYYTDNSKTAEDIRINITLHRKDGQWLIEEIHEI